MGENENMALTLSFEGAEVRMVGTPDFPEWVAADVCGVLGIKQATRALKHLDSDEKGVTTVHTPGGIQEMLTITEPGLYKLLARSRKPEAKRFDRWVRHQVLPSIRRTGSFSVAGGGDNHLMERVTAVLERLEEKQTVVHEEVNELGARVGAMEEAVRGIVRRRNLTPTTKRRHLAAIQAFGGMCPSCSLVRIVHRDGTKSVRLNWEHWHAPHRNAINETWAVCDDCNQTFKDPVKRQAAYMHFLAYQTRRRQLEGDDPQIPLFGGNKKTG